MTDISIILPTYNRSGPLHHTLEALNRCDCSGFSVQLIVIDNCSTDDTARVAAGWVERLAVARGAMKMEYVFESRPGKNHAVNTGLARARGELVVFTDDDVTPVSGWLRQYVWAMRSRPDRNVFCGSVVTPMPEYLKPAVVNSVSCCNFVPDPATEDLPDEDLPLGANYAVRRDVLQTHPNLFDPVYGPKGKTCIAGDETAALTALVKMGHRIVYVRGAEVLHRVSPDYFTLSALCRKAFQQGRGHALITRFGSNSQKLFDVPKFLVPMFCKDLAQAGVGLIAGNRPRALYGLFHAFRVAGVAYEWRHSIAAAERSEKLVVAAGTDTGIYVSDAPVRVTVSPHTSSGAADQQAGTYESDRPRESVAAVREGEG